MILGIDIGSTHTDGVLVQNNKIVAGAKVHTTDPLEWGVAYLMKKLDCKEPIERVTIGTTHVANALLQGRGLLKVGLLRLAGHRPDLPAGLDWPPGLLRAILVGVETVGGGYQCDGRPITPFSEQEAKQAIERLLKAGAQAIAVVGVFSSMCPEQEERVGRLLGSIPHTLSHQMGGIGVIERENVTLLNCTLKLVLKRGFQKLAGILREAGVAAKPEMTQNNGTLISIEEAIENPILTVSAGCTNSFQGGAALAGLKDAIVVDVGGVSTDIGVVRQGFPRRSIHNAQVAGVALNVATPDVISLAIGGESPISSDLRVGRRRKSQRSDDRRQPLTLTEIAVKLGYLGLSCRTEISLSEQSARSVVDDVVERVQRGVIQLAVGAKDLPVVIVGGGAPILTRGQTHQIPQYASLANAYGATMAGISGTIDTCVCLAKKREERLQGLCDQARAKAVAKGADPKRLEIVQQEIIPYHYMPGSYARVILCAAGPALLQRFASVD